jgi:hypothetical protein
VSDHVILFDQQPETAYVLSPSQPPDHLLEGTSIEYYGRNKNGSFVFKLSTANDFASIEDRIQLLKLYAAGRKAEAEKQQIRLRTRHLVDPATSSLTTEGALLFL